jgi:hypothetical protein
MSIVSILSVLALANCGKKTTVASYEEEPSGYVNERMKEFEGYDSGRIDYDEDENCG